MNILFMKSYSTDISFILERQIIKLGILMSDKFVALTPTLTGIMIYQNRDKATVKAVLQNYKYYFSNQGNGHSVEEIDNFFHTYNGLKNKKFKTREEMLNYGKLNNAFIFLRGEVNKASVSWLDSNKIEALLQFNIDGKLVIFDDGLERRLNPFFHIGALIDEFTNTNSFHILGYEEAQRKEIVEEEEDDAKYDLAKINTCEFFEIPCLDTFSYAQLQIIRNEIQEQLKESCDALLEIKSVFYDRIITDENFEAMANEMEALIKPISEKFKNFFDTNIYFLQIKNSSTSHKRYALKIGLASIFSILVLYDQSEIIDTQERDMICEEISRTRDINSAFVFFSLDEIIEE